MRRLVACLLLLSLVAAGTAVADRGDPKRAITKADQARARAMLLRQSDFPPGFVGTPSGPDPAEDYCRAIDESDLTLTGEAESKEFERGLSFVASLAQVYASTAEANASWRRRTSAAGRKCAEAAFRRDAANNGGSVESFGTVPFPRLAQRSFALRLVVSAPTGGRFVADVVLLQQGRAQAALVLGSGLTPTPKAEELRYARVVAGRMALAMRGG